jgi:hypothetical protein
LLGVLHWNLEDAKNNETFDSMFSFWKVDNGAICQVDLTKVNLKE